MRRWCYRFSVGAHKVVKVCYRTARRASAPARGAAGNRVVQVVLSALVLAAALLFILKTYTPQPWMQGAFPFLAQGAESTSRPLYNYTHSYVPPTYSGAVNIP